MVLYLLIFALFAWFFPKPLLKWKPTWIMLFLSIVVGFFLSVVLMAGLLYLVELAELWDDNIIGTMVTAWGVALVILLWSAITTFRHERR